MIFMLPDGVDGAHSPFRIFLFFSIYLPEIYIYSGFSFHICSTYQEALMDEHGFLENKF